MIYVKLVKLLHDITTTKPVPTCSKRKIGFILVLQTYIETNRNFCNNKVQRSKLQSHGEISYFSQCGDKRNLYPYIRQEITVSRIGKIFNTSSFIV